MTKKTPEQQIAESSRLVDGHLICELAVIRIRQYPEPIERAYWVIQRKGPLDGRTHRLHKTCDVPKCITHWECVAIKQTAEQQHTVAQLELVVAKYEALLAWYRSETPELSERANAEILRIKKAMHPDGTQARLARNITNERRAEIMRAVDAAAATHLRTK